MNDQSVYQTPPVIQLTAGRRVVIKGPSQCWLQGRPGYRPRRSGHALAGDQFVYVAVRSAEMLPGRSWLTKQFDASTAQFLDGCREVTDREPYDRPGIKVLPTLVERAEDLDIPVIGELKDPQACASTAPAQAR